jgi:outer membrane protein assembly factor BamB
MQLNVTSKNWLALAITTAQFGAVVPFTSRSSDSAPIIERPRPEPVAMFGGSPSRNLVNLRDKNLPTVWNVAKGKEQNLLWSVELGTKAYGGPIISGGKIFIGTNNGRPRDPKITGDKGVLMCFEERTGKFLWQSVHDKLRAGRVNDWPEEGVVSKPAVEGNRVYYVSNRGEVVCTTTDGLGDGKAENVWRLDMIKELNVFPHNASTCSPLIVGDTLFALTGNGVDLNHLNIPQPAAPSFLAMDKKSGKVLWKSNSPSIRLIEERRKNPAVTIMSLMNKGLVLLHGQWSNPVYAEPSGKPMVIFPGGDGWLRAFNPANGDLLWKFDGNPKSSFYVLGPKATRNDIVATPVIWENKLYVGMGQDPEHLKGVGHLWCIDIGKEPKNLDRDLSPVNDNFDPHAALNKDSALVWHFGGENPTKRPRRYHFGRTISACAVHDGLVYAAEYDGWLHCLDARTGEKHWDHDMEADTWCSPYWVDGKVHLGNENGEMFVFEHGKKKKLLNTIDMNGGLIRDPVVASNGVLFLITENPCKLYAFRAP